MRLLASFSVWLFLTVSASAQFWGTPHAPFMPLDNLPRPTICYGTVRLLSTYIANKALDVTPLGGSTTTIGFVNNRADATTANAACAATNTCYQTQHYDQCGLGADASQTSSGGSPAVNPPIWNGTNSVGGFNTIIFNTDNVADRSNTKIGSTFKSNNANPLTVIIVGQMLRSRQRSDLFQDAQFGLPISNATNTTGIAGIGMPGIAVSATPADVEASILVVQVGNGTMNVWSNDQTSTASATTSATPSLASGYLGASGGLGSISASYDAVAVLIYQTELTTAQINAIRASLAATFNIQQTYTDAIVEDGDSFSSGKGSLYDNSTFRCAISGCIGTSPSVKYPVRGYNNAVDGERCSAIDTNFATTTAPYYQSSYRTFIFHIQAGVNDFRLGGTVAQSITCLQDLSTKVHALGSNAKYIVATQPVQCDVFQSATLLPMLQQYNNFIIANWNVPVAQGGLGADALDDQFDVPIVGPGSYVTTPIYCGGPNQYANADQEHPTDLSMSLYGPTQGASFNAVLP